MDTKSRFLNSAVQSYATSVPALAAYLMFRCKELAFPDNNSGSSLSGAARSCQACGGASIPGWNNHITLSTEPVVISAKSKSSSQQCQTKTATASATARKPQPGGNMLLTECLLCRRFSKSSIPRRKRIPNVSVLEETLQNDQVRGNIISKTKRSRNRSKAGLQALLARSTEPKIQIHELDLMDLMKAA